MCLGSFVTTPMRCSHRLSISVSNTPRRYLAGEHQVDVQVAGDASAAAGCRVWLPAGCRWPRLLCGP